jgi:hypothetical protein
MLKRTAVALTALALVATVPLAPAMAEKKLTPQQQKMKECGARWQTHKTSTGEKGNAAYRKFLSGCMKTA